MTILAASTPSHTYRFGVAAAFLSILVGIGLSRFGYSPLIPAMVEHGWFPASAASYLGAANLAGYLIGAVAGSRFARHLPVKRTMRLAMLLSAMAFLACSVAMPFAYFFIWRLVSGITGGVLMVVGTPAALARVPLPVRGVATGLVFAGVGVGIVISGLLVPPLVALGLPQAWLALGGVCLLATALSWNWWPDGRRPSPADGEKVQQEAKSATPARRELLQPALIAIYITYAMIATGLVPHMVFLVDFIARGLALGVETGGVYWVIFGIGALAGPVMAGRLADRFGFAQTLSWALAGQAAGVAILAFYNHTAALAVSSVVVGAAVSGSLTLVFGHTERTLARPQLQTAAWGIATAVFALGQAGAGYGHAFIFSMTGDYEPLFLSGAFVLALALCVHLAGLALARARHRDGGEAGADCQ